MDRTLYMVLFVGEFVFIGISFLLNAIWLNRAYGVMFMFAMLFSLVAFVNIRMLQEEDRDEIH